IGPRDRVILMVEDDLRFARILLDMAREKGFKGVVATSGEEALEIVTQFRPDAITLDIQLPGMHGLTLLDQIKHDPNLRHIPVHIVSIVDALPRQHRKGAVHQLKKPVTPDSVSEALTHMQEFLDRNIRNLL